MAERIPMRMPILRSSTFLPLLLLLPLVLRPGKPPAATGWSAGAGAGGLDLFAVAVAERGVVWAVGDISPGGTGGLLQKSTDGGETWQPVLRNMEVLTAVHFVSPRTGFLAGYNGRIDRTDDGGETWRTQRAERSSEILSSLWFLDEDNGWAVGAGGLLLRTTDGGAHWASVATGR